MPVGNTGKNTAEAIHASQPLASRVRNGRCWLQTVMPCLPGWYLHLTLFA